MLPGWGGGEGGEGGQGGGLWHKCEAGRGGGAPVGEGGGHVMAHTHGNTTATCSPCNANTKAGGVGVGALLCVRRHSYWDALRLEAAVVAQPKRGRLR